MPELETPEPVILPMREWIARARKVKQRSQKAGRCLYYNEETGERCFIGMSAPVEVAKIWQKTYNGTVDDVLLPYGLVGVSDLPEKHAGRFLGDLQGIHDTFSPERWEEELDRLEVEYTPYIVEGVVN